MIMPIIGYNSIYIKKYGQKIIGCILPDIIFCTPPFTISTRTIFVIVPLFYNKNTTLTSLLLLGLGLSSVIAA